MYADLYIVSIEHNEELKCVCSKNMISVGSAVTQAGRRHTAVFLYVGIYIAH